MLITSIDHTLPSTLPIYTSVPIARATNEAGGEFTLTLGLDRAQVLKFQERSRDTSDQDLMRFTSDRERIGEGSYEAWYAKERYPFALMSSFGDLAGIIWLGPKAFPLLKTGQAPAATLPWHTFAIRLYGEYRGQRMAFPFASFVLDVHKKMFADHPIWLDTEEVNEGAVRLYKKLNFVHCGVSNKDRAVMVRVFLAYASSQNYRI